MNTFDQISAYVDAYVRDTIDTNYPAKADPCARGQAALDAGKALILLGTAYVGNALGCLDPEQPVLFAKQLLARLATLGDVLKGQN